MPIVAKGLVKTYKRRAVVNGTDLRVDRGEVVGLLGPNGAGKTTTFYMVVGLVRPNAGTIYLDDRDVTSLPMYERARLGIGYLAQEPSVFRRLSVEDNIKLVLEMCGADRKMQSEKLERALDDFHIEGIRKLRGYQLSGGEARRVEVARAVVLEPSYLLLDEPFLGVDPITIADMQDIIRRLREERNIGILVTDHNVKDTLAITDRAYILSDGEVKVSGTSSEIASSPIARKFYLGEGFSYGVQQ